LVVEKVEHDTEYAMVPDALLNALDFACWMAGTVGRQGAGGVGSSIDIGEAETIDQK
jgi:hypothetical protein